MGNCAAQPILAEDDDEDTPSNKHEGAELESIPQSSYFWPTKLLMLAEAGLFNTFVGTSSTTQHAKRTKGSSQTQGHANVAQQTFTIQGREVRIKRLTAVGSSQSDWHAGTLYSVMVVSASPTCLHVRYRSQLPRLRSWGRR
jgi:hypothetical protein